MSDAEVKALKQEIKKGMDKASVKTLRILYHILEIENEEEDDWWDDLPEHVLKAIDEGLEDIKKGNVITHEEFLKRNKRWLKK